MPRLRPREKRALRRTGRLGLESPPSGGRSAPSRPHGQSCAAGMSRQQSARLTRADASKRPSTKRCGYHVTLIDLGGGHIVAVVVDTATDADLEAFVDEAMPVIETFRFAEH